jgi:hypothetical protein
MGRDSPVIGPGSAVVPAPPFPLQQGSKVRGVGARHLALRKLRARSLTGTTTVRQSLTLRCAASSHPGGNVPTGPPKALFRAPRQATSRPPACGASYAFLSRRDERGPSATKTPVLAPQRYQSHFAFTFTPHRWPARGPATISWSLGPPRASTPVGRRRVAPVCAWRPQRGEGRHARP